MGGNHNNISSEPHSFIFLSDPPRNLRTLNVIFLKSGDIRTNTYLYQWDGREFRGGSDEKMRRMWFKQELLWFPPMTPHHVIL